MAKAKTPNQKKAYERLNKRLAKYVAKVRAVYDTLNLEASKIATRTDYDVEQGKPFRWSDYPQTTAQVKKLQQRFVNDMGVIIMSGTSEEWANSNELQDLLADKVIRAYNVKRGDSRTKKYYQVNNDALQAFQQRRDNGMNLSDRLWNQAEDYKKGLETTLSTAIERGMSAVVLSKRVSKYLRDFDSLKKDYKKRFGTATDIHDCEYRSVRLARSEINMAYRNAEQLRWQQMDFILGYEIKLSHSHPCHDICDDLKGKYPKDFKWTGWHPNDLCYVIPIIKTEEQFWLPKEERGKDNDEITDVPQGFKTWVANNQDRIARAEKRGTLPYFVRDNRERVKLVKNGVNAINVLQGGNGLNLTKVKSIKEISEERHQSRTKEQIALLKGVWRKRVINNAIETSLNLGYIDDELDKIILSLKKANKSDDGNLFTSAYNKLRTRITNINNKYNSNLSFTPEQEMRFAEMEKTLGIKRGKPMSAIKADMQRANPNYKPNSETSINCQTCSPAYVLRSQGFDVYATGKTKGSVQEWISKQHSFDIWENIDGTPAKPTLYKDWLNSKGYKQMTPKRYLEFYEEATKETGIYIITIGWKKGGGHATILQRFADGSLAYIEPQLFEITKGVKRDVLEICNKGVTIINKRQSKRGIMRVDDKLLKRFCTDSATGKTYDVWSIFGIK